MSGQGYKCRGGSRCKFQRNDAPISDLQLRGTDDRGQHGSIHLKVRLHSNENEKRANRDSGDYYRSSSEIVPINENVLISPFPGRSSGFSKRNSV